MPWRGRNPELRILLWPVCRAWNLKMVRIIWPLMLIRADARIAGVSQVGPWYILFCQGLGIDM